MKLWIAIVVLMFATVGHAGKAEAGSYYVSGSVLLERCESDSGAKQNVCIGYLAGMSDITNTYEALGLTDKYFCIPKGATLDQLQKVAIKGLKERPEKLHRGASTLVWNIFARAFPC